jgi:Holliday junction resolvase RusA-like endonuclease
LDRQDGAEGGSACFSGLEFGQEILQPVDRWATFHVKPILEIHIETLPYRWVRTRGSTHYKHPSLESWQKFLKSVAEEEVSMSAEPARFPLTRCAASLLLLYPNHELMKAAPDGDNMEKGILDALNKVVWADDRGRILRGFRWYVDVARIGELSGTHLFIYPI